MMTARELAAHEKYAEEFQPGLYAHRKGGRYTALFLAMHLSRTPSRSNRILVAKHHETRADLSVYANDDGLFIVVPNEVEVDDWAWVVYVSTSTGAVIARPLARPGEDSWVDPVDWNVVPIEWGIPTREGVKQVEVLPRFYRVPAAEQPK